MSHLRSDDLRGNISNKKPSRSLPTTQNTSTRRTHDEAVHNSAHPQCRYSQQAVHHSAHPQRRHSQQAVHHSAHPQRRHSQQAVHHSTHSQRRQQAVHHSALPKRRIDRTSSPDASTHNYTIIRLL
ncbi:histidine-rich glycoprotein-like isoform X2 [Drosophila rhopaloa]|uniref:Uncharacterized protein n=1 Tax=Drosophila rhopaloa TaxID=1041015 RepID=A0ABM5J8N2_DRORH|nr:histidine-rich glycoprotein-like isoform X2 [Drosophila rhopaloa]